jgi:hypothetical protein
MKRRGVWVLLGSVLLHSSVALAKDQTVKAPLAEVRTAAQKWQADAVLVHLSTVKAKLDGTASEWKYSFYSPATKKRYVVTAAGGKIDGLEVRLGEETKPLGDFIDSDKAMAEAKKAGIKGNEPSMSVGFQGSGKSAGLYWVVTGGFTKGDVSVMLEAATGKLFSRSVMD